MWSFACDEEIIATVTSYFTLVTLVLAMSRCHVRAPFQSVTCSWYALTVLIVLFQHFCFQLLCNIIGASFIYFWCFNKNIKGYFLGRATNVVDASSRCVEKQSWPWKPQLLRTWARLSTKHQQSTSLTTIAAISGSKQKQSTPSDASAVAEWQWQAASYKYVFKTIVAWSNILNLGSGI